MQQHLSFRGRAPRATFWWTLVLATAAFVVLFVFLDSMIGRAATWILYPPYLWVLASVVTRRLRDRGRPPAWWLAALVPVLGPLWLAVELGFRRGTPGENPYGPDPLTLHTGYLTVDIHHP